MKNNKISINIPSNPKLVLGLKILKWDSDKNLYRFTSRSWFVFKISDFSLSTL